MGSCSRDHLPVAACGPGEVRRRHPGRGCRTRPTIHAPEAERGKPGAGTSHDSHSVAIAPFDSDSSAMVDTSLPVAGSRCTCALTLVTLRAGEPADAVDIVHGVAEERAVVLRAALPGRQRFQAPGVQDQFQDHADAADGALADEPARLQVADAEALPEHDHELDPRRAHGSRMRSHSSTVVAMGLSSRICLPRLRRGDGLRGVCGVRRADEDGVDIVARRPALPPTAPRSTPILARPAPAARLPPAMATRRARSRYRVTVSALVRPMKPEPIMPMRTSFIDRPIPAGAARSAQDGLARGVVCGLHDLLQAGPAVLQGRAAAEQDLPLAPRSTSFRMASKPITQEVSRCTVSWRRISATAICSSCR